MRCTRGLVAGGLLAGVVLAGCDSSVAGRGTAAPEAAPQSPGAGPGSAGSATPAPSTSAPGGRREPRVSTGPCRYTETAATVANPSNKDVGLPPDPDPTPATGTQAVALTTSRGAIVITLDRAQAPCAVQSFLYLVGVRFFDNTTCPRVTGPADGLAILQCGDPKGDASGGPTYQHREENLAAADYRTGVVAMANAGRDTTGSQFFILYADAPTLPKSYSVIGRVTAGLEVVTTVGNAGHDGSSAGGGGRPRLPVTIATART